VKDILTIFFYKGSHHIPSAIIGKISIDKDILIDRGELLEFVDGEETTYEFKILVEWKHGSYFEFLFTFEDCVDVRPIIILNSDGFKGHTSTIIDKVGRKLWNDLIRIGWQKENMQ
jgi:hypothetical protein